MCKPEEEKKEECCCSHMKKMFPAFPIIPLVYPIGVGLTIGICGVVALHKIACYLKKIAVTLKEKE